MTYAIAAAGTGGHVYPGIAVAEALVASGVASSEIVFFGGARMEAAAVPEAGFPFVELRIQGLSRSVSPANLKLPAVVWRAMSQARTEMAERRVKAVLCMGGYVTVPVGLAARRQGAPLFLHEQNAHAGIANRMMARLAHRSFVAFPNTTGLKGEVIGNPLRPAFADFDGEALRDAAMKRYHFDPEVPCIGVFGGSLGARAINEAVGSMAGNWRGAAIQIVHLVGSIHESVVSTDGDAATVTRRVVGFEDRMDLFFAAADVVVARAGGSLFEIAASGTPMVVVPGTFGGGHQAANADAMRQAGAAVVISEEDLDSLEATLGEILSDGARRASMGDAALRAARPDAAMTIAAAMMEAAHA